MLDVRRSPLNPILSPNPQNDWEAEAAFNPSAAEGMGKVHLLYRAVSREAEIGGVKRAVSSIGYAVGRDGVRFAARRQIIAPEKEWEQFGCEDPRITRFEGRYFIFYTALSRYPFVPEGIKIGLAVTKDFKTFEKHPVTPFNAKAMVLFPERVQGKIAAVLTAHTDTPPAKICLALFDRVEDMWDPEYWRWWHADIDRHVISLAKGERDHLEAGAPPILTSDGWLFFYSYIYNYFSPPAVFGVQAALLGRTDPRVIVGEVKRPFLVPHEDYERAGKAPNIVFPSGALLRGKTVYLYYGGADTVSCLATMKLADIVDQLTAVTRRKLLRFAGNPILEPKKGSPWESKATFNPAAILEGGDVHILYRAMSEDNTSAIGYARSRDGFQIEERLPYPVYEPREEFELKKIPGGNSGCEDPRLTRIGGTIYMCYTAYNGANPPRVALTSIARNDFLAHRWNWKKPIVISPPGVDDKDAALFPKKINGKYAFLHRQGGVNIWIDVVPDFNFARERFLGGSVLMDPRETLWDSKRIGIAGPPIETKDGWLLIYHGISKRTNHYHVRAALLSKKDPRRILRRTHDPILEPEAAYEREGLVPNVVFPCGAVVKDGILFVYYGGADKVVGVGTVKLKDLLSGMKT